MSQTKNHYNILGIPSSSPHSEVRAAYIKLALRFHPDTGNTPDHAQFAEITESYQVLKDNDRRRSYDAELRILGLQCDAFEGSGVVFHSRGFTGGWEAPCPVCNGSGLK